LYFKNAAGVVTLLADSSGALGTVTSVDVSGGTTGLTTSGGPITSSGTITLAGTLGVANGGTGATTFTANGVVYGNTTSALLVTAAGTTGQVLVGNTGGAPSWATLSGIGVTSFSGGTTGLTPNTATTGVVTLAGTLGVANGGTGTATAFTAGSVVFAGASGVYSQNNANFFWDNTNSRLGIGTATPSARLNVSGTAAMSRFQTGSAADGRVEFAYNTTDIGYLNMASATQFELYGRSGVTLAFGAGGSERMRIDSSGNVGIGITNPQQLLALGTSTDQVGAGVSGVVSTVFFGTPTNLAGGMRRISYDRATGNLSFIDGSIASPTTQMTVTAAGNVGIGTSAPGAKFQVIGSTTVGGYANVAAAFGAGVSSELYVGSLNGNNPYIGSGGAFPLSFNTNGAERMRIDSSGNLLVGTTSQIAAAKLTIQANGAYLALSTTGAGFSLIRGLDNTTERWSIGQIGFGGTDGMAFYIGAANTEAMRINASGNVGIGTVSPGTYNLNVAGALRAGNSIDFGNANADPTIVNVGVGATGNRFALIDFIGDTTYTDYGLRIGRLNDGANGTSEIQHRGTGALALNALDAGVILLQTSGTERARIDSSGNLLVGTTATGGSGTTIYNAAANSNVGRIDIGKSASGAATAMTFRFGASAVGSITYDDTATAYNTSSDYRLKDIDGPIANSGAYIDALNPVQGSWKVDGSRFIGLLAHEVQEVSETPIATGEKDGEKMQAMDYSAPELIANLIAEIQSLRARVAQLEGN
jgi:hypothetical protein